MTGHGGDATASLSTGPLAEIIERVPQLAEAELLSVASLPGGLSNTNYVVTADGEPYVVRIAASIGPMSGLDRRREEAATRRAAAAGVAPRVVAFFQPEGHSVIQHRSARTLSPEEFTSAEMLPRVAARLRDIHHLAPIDGTFDPYANIRGWLPVIGDRGTAVPNRLEALLEKVAVTERALPRDRDTVLCHNDAWARNFLDDGSLWVIDWEYAGMGDPLFDLACVGYASDTAGRDLLLDSYFGAGAGPGRVELDRMIEVYLGHWVVWSLFQVSESRIDFDYAAFAEELLDFAPSSG